MFKPICFYTDSNKKAILTRKQTIFINFQSQIKETPKKKLKMSASAFNNIIVDYKI